jgi:transcriptional regulator with PAS, ATPase and Fis domain
MNLIGNSRAILSLKEELEFLRNSDAKVLITGESGVGKEVVAKLIHSHSRRASARLVSVNCAGIAESLLESELFGHVKGSFTGAYRDKPGLLEQADGGTIFLDEIGEMSLRMQAVLLRFLETGEIQPVGSLAARGCLNVRVIAATNRSLYQQVQAGAFRADLFYRINVVHLTIPPLRQRRDDIAPLTMHFLQVLSEQQKLPQPRLSNEVMQQFLAYSWPGNVRELKNIVERLIVRRAGQDISATDLPPWAHETWAAPGRAADPGPTVADQLLERMTKNGESFWSVVHPAFVSRDLTRDTLRELLNKALSQTRGSYRTLLPLFNIKDSDYRRFLAFLRKHQIHRPFQRMAPASAADASTSHSKTA